MALRAPSTFATPRAYHRLDPTPVSSSASHQGSLVGALNAPKESCIPPPSPRVASSATPAAYGSAGAVAQRLPQSPAGPTSRRPPAAPSAPAKTAILKALSRCLHGQRHTTLALAMSTWRLSLSHILRHQALTRLQAQSQAQQQSLAALRRSLPSTPAPRPGHPTGGGGTATAAQQQVSQQGSSLLRDALLARLVRSAKLLCVCSALGRWRLAALAISSDAGAVAASINGKGHGPGGISSTAPRALKRASAQEAAIAGLKEKLAGLEAELGEKSRVLALTAKQLATADSRRRVAEQGGKHAQDALAKMQLTAGRQHAKDEELQGYRDAEVEWASEARRLVAERALLSSELVGEEKAGAHAKELVISCHAALLRQRQDARRAAEVLNANWRKGLARSAAQQSAMASDLRALGNVLARCTAQRKAEAAARRRAAANLGGTPTRTSGAQTDTGAAAAGSGVAHAASHAASGVATAAARRGRGAATPTTRTLGFATPCGATGGGAAGGRGNLATGRAQGGGACCGQAGWHGGFHAAVSEAEEAVADRAEDDDEEEAAEGRKADDGDAEEDDDDFAAAEAEAEAEAASTAASSSQAAAASETAPRTAAGPSVARHAVASTPATVAVAAAARASLHAASLGPPLTFTAACDRAASLGESLMATVAEARAAALRRVLHTTIDRRLGLGWRSWEAAHALSTYNEAPYVAALDARDSAVAEVERLRGQLVDTRTQLAGARESLSKAKAAALHNPMVAELSHKVQMLTKRLHAEQQKGHAADRAGRAAKEAKEAASRQASATRYAAALAAAPLQARTKSAPEPSPHQPAAAPPRERSPPSASLSHLAPSPQLHPPDQPPDQPQQAWGHSASVGEAAAVPEVPRQVTSSAVAQVRPMAADVAQVPVPVPVPVPVSGHVVEDSKVGGGAADFDVWSDGTPRLRPKAPASLSQASPALVTPALAASPYELPSSLGGDGHGGSVSCAAHPSIAAGAGGSSSLSRRAATSARIQAARAKAAAILAGDDDDPVEF